VAWPVDGQRILVDGHNRYRICQAHGLSFAVVERAFDSRDAAQDWIDANQLGRRNLSPDAAALLIGRRYNRVKKAQGGTGANQYVAREQTGHSVTSALSENTAELLAAEHGVSDRTVKRAGAFASAVEALSDVAPELPQRIMAGDGPTRKDVIAAAAVVNTEPEKAAAIVKPHVAHSAIVFIDVAGPGIDDRCSD
jgi:hypothetical protein